MFGLFKKKSDYDIYLESGMPLVEHFINMEYTQVMNHCFRKILWH